MKESPFAAKSNTSMAVKKRINTAIATANDMMVFIRFTVRRRE